MRPLGLIIWRLKHSRLRREFHAQIAAGFDPAALRGWILDVGSGPGLLARRLRTAHPDLRVVCVDIEPRMLEEARSLGCGDLVRASADLLPFRSDVLDTVLSTASLKDWGNRARGLSEIARVLRPGGAAFVYDFITVGPGSNPPGFVRRYGVFAELLRRRMGRMIPFSAHDLQGLADSLRTGAVQTRVDEVRDFGAARIVLTKGAARSMPEAGPTPGVHRSGVARGP